MNFKKENPPEENQLPSTQNKQNQQEIIEELSEKIKNQKEILDNLSNVVNQLENEMKNSYHKPSILTYLPHIFVIFCILVLIAKSYKTIL